MRELWCCLRCCWTCLLSAHEWGKWASKYVKNIWTVSVISGGLSLSIQAELHCDENVPSFLKSWMCSRSSIRWKYETLPRKKDPVPPRSVWGVAKWMALLCLWWNDYLQLKQRPCVSLWPGSPFSGGLTVNQSGPQVPSQDRISLLTHAQTNHHSSHLK